MKVKNSVPQIMNGGIFKDERGTIRFANEFKLDGLKRFYVLEHNDTTVVRAWQGHKKEKKYFFPIKGSFVVAWVKINDFERPNRNLKAEFIILDADKKLDILCIPPGYANGFRALKSHSILGVFSDLELEESNKDIVRFPADWWFDWKKVSSTE